MLLSKRFATRFVLLPLRCIVWHVSISDPASRSELIIQPDGNYNFLTSTMAAVTRSLPSEKKKIHTVPKYSGLCFCSTFHQRDSMKWLLLFYQVNTKHSFDVSHVPNSNLGLCVVKRHQQRLLLSVRRLTLCWTDMLRQTEMWLLRPGGRQWQKTVGGYWDEMHQSHSKRAELHHSFL